ncbi:hypothetical protein AVEN_118480-1 [Araneus ventricosus]|uniref:Uncharacterized protein n=1 Tax=Araneus ventricosus TaxID=182803 RepID=A0A4Y2WXW6_ARAVE|nr:hypothetical protein AVEN_63342-1 [Araneus ventricosus]GBO41469.1 hypothetical protein AVEN_118480-1 [Araneus ventricosus]
MESHFPAMLVLWLGREFYRYMYGNAAEMEPATSNVGDKLGDHYGGKFGHVGSQKYWNFLDISIRSRDPDLSDDSMRHHGLSRRL